MKKILAAAALAALSAVPAQADIFDYAELFGGVTFEPDLGVNGVDTSLETGYNVGGSLGWMVSPQFAVEADFFFTAADYDILAPAESSLESFSFMLNALYHFDAGSGVKPYIGAGAGGVQLRFTDGTTSGGAPYTGDTDTVFGYQGIAGVAFEAEEKLDVFIEYRYQGAEDAEGAIRSGIILAPIEWEYESHNVTAGFRFRL